MLQSQRSNRKIKSTNKWWCFIIIIIIITIIIIIIIIIIIDLDETLLILRGKSTSYPADKQYEVKLNELQF